MDALLKRGIIILVATFFIMCTVAVVAFFVGRSYNRINEPVRQQLERAAEINRELADEQQRAIKAAERATRQLEAIRRLTEDADQSLKELINANRRSSDISAQIRAQANLLADYFRDVSSIVDNNINNVGGE